MVEIGVLASKTRKEGRFSIPTISEVLGAEENLPIDPYILGYWIGDGTSAKPEINVHGDDLTNLEENLKRSGYIYKITKIKEKNVYTVRIPEILQPLRELNLIKNKHIPKSYLRSDVSSRIALFQGIMDSDGTCDNRGRLELTFKQECLIEDVRELIASLGCRVGAAKKKVVDTYTKGATYFRLSMSIYRELDFDCFRLKRKLDRQKTAPHENRKKSTKKRQIVSIEPVDSVPVRCITVESTQSLFAVTRSFILTHNSSSTVGYLLHEMIFNQDMKVGITSYKLANCKDLMARFKFAYENLPIWLKPPVIEYNRYSVAFTNGSSIEAQVTRENTFRGNTPKIIYIDELAFVKPSVAEEFWGGLLPSLTAEGENADVKLIITSTPNGSGDLFSSIWFGAVAGTNGFIPVEVKYEEVPGRTEKFRKDMIAKFGLTKFLQEFCCQFLSDKGTLINSQILEDMESEDPILHPDESLYLWEKDLKGKNIAISIDVSEGIGKDYHAMHIADIDSFEQIGEYKNNTLTQTKYVKDIVKTIDLMFKLGASEVYYTVENNSIGMGVIALLQGVEDESLDRATFVSHADYPNKVGMPTNSKTKPHGCQRLKDMVELGKYKIKSQYLINELKFFVKSKTSFAAESGKNDDLAMAAVLMMLLLEQIGDYEESAYEKMSEVSYDQEQDAYEVGIFF